MKVVVPYIVCILLSLFFSTFVGAQTEPAEAAIPSPLKVDVIKISEGPLSLAVQSIDETQPSYRIVHYNIQNNTDKAVKSSVLKMEGGGIGSIMTHYGRFAGNSVNESDFRVERKDRNQMISIEIDFVLFADGSTWGSDSLKRSGDVLAHYKGKETAVERFRQLVEDNGVKSMNEIFASELSELQPLMDTRFEFMTETARRAFLSGYRSTVFGFKRDFEARGVQGISDRLKNPDSF